ncbi:MAG: ABC transporter ATP-binding protein [Bacillota bacterium]|jgi:oligopeptide transport system ATP-binding protein
MAEAPVLVDVQNLRKVFPVGRNRYLRAVDNVSFQIRRGETLGLVGESGCGKTTVGRTLIRLYPADGGRVVFDRIDVHRANRREARELTKRMQMIFQDPYASLNPFFTVHEIIAEGLEIHGLCRNRREQTERVHELLEMVGLHPEHASRFPFEFSGGQRQRIGIARALAVNPEFIICDEPISALDVSVQAQIINLLMDLQREMGLTYLFIAHDLSVVRHISDNVAVMYLGAVVESGPTDSVYDDPQHPYTQGLLAAVPVADPDYEVRRSRELLLTGDVPSPLDVGEGCKFCKRCHKASELCSRVTPELQDVGGGHMVACHHLG